MFYLNTRLTKRILGVLALSASFAFAAELKMATTTSTDNTGLLDVLAPQYKKDTGVDLKWVAVGQSYPCKGPMWLQTFIPNKPKCI